MVLFESSHPSRSKATDNSQTYAPRQVPPVVPQVVVAFRRTSSSSIAQSPALTDNRRWPDGRTASVAPLPRRPWEREDWGIVNCQQSIVNRPPTSNTVYLYTIYPIPKFSGGRPRRQAQPDEEAPGARGGPRSPAVPGEEAGARGGPRSPAVPGEEAGAAHDRQRAIREMQLKSADYFSSRVTFIRVGKP
jgi:hypothetical protein